MRALKAHWPKMLVHVCALIPLAWLLWAFTQGQLTANPIREIQLRTGRYTLGLLGIYAFAYASLHLLNFIGLDYGFNFPLLWTDIAGKRFVIAGFAAFLVLLALALTSTEGWKRRLGKNWRRLHRLIYGAALLAVLHFMWQTRADFRLPFIYGGAVVLLLALRIPRIQTLMRLRRRQG